MNRRDILKSFIATPVVAALPTMQIPKPGLRKYLVYEEVPIEQHPDYKMFKHSFDGLTHFIRPRWKSYE